MANGQSDSVFDAFNILNTGVNVLNAHEMHACTNIWVKIFTKKLFVAQNMKYEH